MAVTTDKKSSAPNIELGTPALNWIDGEWIDSEKHTDARASFGCHPICDRFCWNRSTMVRTSLSLAASPSIQ
ncbi:hypothetical protein [Nostoc sp.]|uniref:hypothetical protein n=1 Tax=Nostoc sp. TaxID=1180 RepID=UPI002FF7D8DC